jgi:hypothetical protein
MADTARPSGNSSRAGRKAQLRVQLQTKVGAVVAEPAVIVSVQPELLIAIVVATIGDGVVPDGRVSGAPVLPIAVVRSRKFAGYVPFVGRRVARRRRALADQVGDADHGNRRQNSNQHDGDENLDQREALLVLVTVDVGR